MGEVYRARDTILKRDVAIKVLPDYWSRDPERLRRLDLEAQSAAALTHPNIVSIYHVGRYDGSPYIVTELLHGETLRVRLRHGPIPVRKALDYAVQIAHGLAAAHDHGIVHRDLKPENLFVTKDGRVKILDFGLAKLGPSKEASGQEPTVTQQTSPGTVMGTVGYMSPEQVRGKDADHRSDIFALGTIFYEMVTGKQTFRKPTSAESMSAILNEEPPSISQITPGTPPGLQRVVHRCLEKDPEQRFHSAHDLAFALEALSDSSTSAGTAVDQKRRSHSALALGIGAAVLILIAAAIVVWREMPPSAPVVESVVQLTDDGEPKNGKLATDGSRVYFNEGTPGSYRIVQVAVTGGATSVIPTAVPSPRIAGLTAEGSAMLTIANTTVLLERESLWTIPLPAGEPRRLGTIEADDASLLTDGRIAFTRGNEVYVAAKDGSQVRKVETVVDGGFFGIGTPTVSPDGQRLILARNSGSVFSRLSERSTNGSSLQPMVKLLQNLAVCCAEWTRDGNFLLFSKLNGDTWDIYMLPRPGAFSRRSPEPVRLTNGPLSYTGSVSSRDGRQIFAIGTRHRGELVRYDGKSSQFVPFLSGISAIDPTFSADGNWVAYESYPDHNLWRSRVDGTERLQLSYPPLLTLNPFLSPDGKRVTFATPTGEMYVVSADGGTPQKIVDKDTGSATWSPDGNILAVSFYTRAGPFLATYDLRSGKLSRFPSSTGLIGAQWLTQDTLIAAAQHPARMVSFDLRTGKWSDLIMGSVENWSMSPDYKYFYYTTAGEEPEALRLRVADHKVERVGSLKQLRRASDWVSYGTQISVTADGSTVFTRDIGSQEIYELTVKWP